MVDRITWFCFLALTVITPILFSTKNTELFEVPKMLFVYLAASFITIATFLKFIATKQIIIPKNLPLLFLLILLVTQVASTFTSIDKFTSVFGYPSRLNGGLLSQLAYILIFFCAIVNLDRVRSQKLILASIITAVVVSLWGIPAHFGRDPNCLILTGSLNASCWQKEFDPTVRIFSTLGQPNWLASYLVLVIPISLTFAMLSKTAPRRLLFSATTIIIFIALIFTNSRAGFVGLIAALTILFAFLGLTQIKKNAKAIFAIFALLIILVFLFGPTLIARIFEIVKGPDPTKPSGTESTYIRLIVWQGAIEVFKKYPLLGSGPETFAYSYYQSRPTAHNETSEWNFFYNKAHNEFLNYLATLGILGAASYIGFLTATVFALSKLNSTPAKSILAGVLGYQTTIFFGFSTVATQTLMFLLIGAYLTHSKGQKDLVVSLKSLKFPHQLLIGSVVVLSGSWIVVGVIRLYFADILITKARSMADKDPKTLPSYTLAISTFPAKNPFYLADAAYATSAYTSPELVENSTALAKKAQNFAPNNLLILRKVANTYFLLSSTDTAYENDAIRVAERLTQLAPTDPQSYLSLAKIQAGLDRIADARKSLQKALELKPDYLEAIDLLDQIKAKEIQ